MTNLPDADSGVSPLSLGVRTQGVGLHDPIGAQGQRLCFEE